MAQIEVTQADRDAAWPFADFHCLPDVQMRERWFVGYYDNMGQGAAIRSFARHRAAGIAEGTEEAAVIAHQRYDELLADECEKQAEAVWEVVDAIRAAKENDHV